jgi:hypothetical protein
VPADPTANPAQTTVAAKPRAMVIIRSFRGASQCNEQLFWWIKDYDKIATWAFANVSAFLRSR